MTKYNWDERHIITFPEKELALETKDLHVYYGQKRSHQRYRHAIREK